MSMKDETEPNMQSAGLSQTRRKNVPRKGRQTVKELRQNMNE